MRAVDTAVVTIASGRHDALTRQQAFLAETDPTTPRVVVALGDDEVARVAEDLGAHVVWLPAAGELPLAAGRNAGAAAALDVGASLLVFLDVDCLAGPRCLRSYRWAAARAEEPALLAGPVTYLPAERVPSAPGELGRWRDPHPARSDPGPDPRLMSEARVELFWSLSFAVTASSWERFGGFDEGFVGYGAEDTDFAVRAEQAGARLWWVGGADAFHQHHATSDPPVQHLDAILRNGGRFADRHGWWPMTGWFSAFEEAGLVRREGMDGARR